jgi:hypothetical protein
MLRDLLNRATAALKFDRTTSAFSERAAATASLTSCTNSVVASNGAAWPAPRITYVLAVGIADASDRTSGAMKAGLRSP